jgi:hypothetical protein
MSGEHKNYYQVLDIQPDAGPRDIEKAYRRALCLYAEDSNAIYSILSDQDSSHMRELIEEAYIILSSDENRKQYNQKRGITVDLKTNENHMIPTAPEPRPVNKYELNYKIDNDFETEIENTTEFTGEFLKKVREYKEVSIKRLCEMTKIMAPYLVYLEEENFEKMPATAYVRGFVFQYAKYLKLNPDLVSSSYIAKVKEKRMEITFQ